MFPHNDLGDKENRNVVAIFSTHDCLRRLGSGGMATTGAAVTLGRKLAGWCGSLVQRSYSLGDVRQPNRGEFPPLSAWFKLGEAD